MCYLGDNMTSLGVAWTIGHILYVIRLGNWEQVHWFDSGSSPSQVGGWRKKKQNSVMGCLAHIIIFTKTKLRL